LKKFIVLSVGIVGLVPLLQQEVIQANNTVQNVRQQKSDPMKNLETHQQITPISDTHITARFIDEAGHDVHPTINVPVRDMGSVLKYDVGLEVFPHFKGYELQNSLDVSNVVTDPNQVITLRYQTEGGAKTVGVQKPEQQLPDNQRFSKDTLQLAKPLEKVIAQKPLPQPNSDSKPTDQKQKFAKPVAATNSQPQTLVTSQPPLSQKEKTRGQEKPQKDQRQGTAGQNPTLVSKNKSNEPAGSQPSSVSSADNPANHKIDAILRAKDSKKTQSATVQTNKDTPVHPEKVNQKSHENDTHIQLRIQNQLKLNNRQDSKPESNRSSSVDQQEDSKKIIDASSQTDHDSKPDGNKGRATSRRAITSKGKRKKPRSPKKNSDLSQKQLIVHAQGFDNNGHQLFDKEIKPLSADLSQFTHEDIEFYGYDLDTQKYDSKTNILTLHYHPRRLILKICNIDENGETISSREVEASYGTEYTLTPQKIDGYRAEDPTNSIQINRLLMPNIYVKYHKETTSAKPDDRRQSSIVNPKQDPPAAINRVKEATPSADIAVSHTENTQQTAVAKQRKTNKPRLSKRGQSKMVHSKKRTKKQVKRDKLTRRQRKNGRNSRRLFAKNSNRRKQRSKQRQLPQTGESHSKQTLLFGWLLLVGLACQKSFKWLH
jgi:hypothetical protein